MRLWRRRIFSSSTEETIPITKPVPLYQRVWLSVIGIYLFIVFPLVTLIQPISVRLAVSRSGIPADIPFIRDAFRLIDTDTVFRVVLSIFTIWTGMSMWRHRWRTVPAMNGCLLVLIAYNVLFYPLMQLTADGSITESVVGVLQRLLHTPVLFAGISYLYFRNRV